MSGMSDKPHSEKPEGRCAQREGVELAGAVVHTLREMLNSPNPSAPDMDLLREVPGLEEFRKELLALRGLSLSLSRGELAPKFEHDATRRGFVMDALKALQSNLRHLTGQARRIASGNLDVRVHFFGEFSTAFNCMAGELKAVLDEKERLATMYKELSDHDPLTGLYTRAAFMEFASRILASEAYGDRPSALIMGDIDHFKTINDTFGHLCGDEVLRCFGEMVRRKLRQEDVVCRYGGEEFLILTPGLCSDRARNVAQRLRSAVREMEIDWEGEKVSITASLGVCGVPPVERGGVTSRFLRECIQIADLSLYQAKRSGRNRVVCADCEECEDCRDGGECAGPQA